MIVEHTSQRKPSVLPYSRLYPGFQLARQRRSDRSERCGASRHSQFIAARNDYEGWGETLAYGSGFRGGRARISLCYEDRRVRLLPSPPDGLWYPPDRPRALPSPVFPCRAVLSLRRVISFRSRWRQRRRWGEPGDAAGERVARGKGRWAKERTSGRVEKRGQGRGRVAAGQKDIWLCIMYLDPRVIYAFVIFHIEREGEQVYACTSVRLYRCVCACENLSFSFS